MPGDELEIFRFAVYSKNMSSTRDLLVNPTFCAFITMSREPSIDDFTFVIGDWVNEKMDSTNTRHSMVRDGDTYRLNVVTGASYDTSMLQKGGTIPAKIIYHRAEYHYDMVVGKDLMENMV